MVVKLGTRRRDLGLCTYCPKLCRFACPTAEAERRETVTPWGKMTLAELLRGGGLEADDEVAEVFYHCLGCLHCHHHCRHAVDVPTTLVAARSMVHELGLAPARLQPLLDNLAAGRSLSGKQLRTALADRGDTASQLPEARAVFFAGCRLLEDGPALAAHLRAWRALGVDYLAVYDGDPLCCGLPYWWAGDPAGFAAQAARLAALLRPYRRVVCACPSCALALRLLFPQVDAPVGAQVLHELELLAQLADERKLSASGLPGSYAVHLPCNLVRGLEAAPAAGRALEALFADCRQPPGWSGADSFCCGGGGLVPELLPQVAESIARRRLSQLAEVGAETVLTACPGCRQQLRQVAGQAPVRDLFVVLDELLSGE